jgi:hypothetical protein
MGGSHVVDVDEWNLFGLALVGWAGQVVFGQGIHFDRLVLELAQVLHATPTTKPEKKNK